MRRAVVALAALAMLAAVAVAAPAAEAARSCAPQKLTFKRKPGAASGTLSWRASRRAPRRSRYRVWRDGKVVGQTSRRRMRVRVSVNRAFRLRVRAIDRRGRGAGCSAALRLRIPYKLPSRPRYLAARDLDGPAARLSWEPSKRGEARVGGYRVLRDGKVYRQTPHTVMRVRVASKRSYRFTVAAVDRNGQLSRASNAVTVVTGHTGPETPQGFGAAVVSDSEVDLAWQPARIKRGAIRGYRPLRDGKVLGQTRSTSTRASNLFAATDYAFQVQAVDTLGYVSEPSPVVGARTHDPVPTAGHAHAFLLATTGQSFTDFRKNYRSIGTVYPTYYECNWQSAKLLGRNDPLVTRFAQQRKVRTLPRFNCQSGATLNRILRDPAIRAQWLDGIVGEVTKNGYDGAMIDFEAGYPGDRDVLSSFMAELSDRLHALGKTVAISVSAKTADVPNHPRSTFFDYNALSESVDTIFVMAWGIKWARSAPGAQDALPWYTGVVNYVASLPRKQRFAMGMQLYGMDWANGGGSSNPAVAREYEDVMALRARTGATPVHDPVEDAYHFSYRDSAGSHDVWYTEAATQATRIKLVRAAGLGGVGFWRLGREDQRLWDNPALAPGAAW